MLKNRLLVGLVAFAVSFGISLVTSRFKDPSKALLTGFIAIPAALVAALVSERRVDSPAKMRMETLKSHVRALQRKRAEVYQELVAIAAERQQVEASFNALQMQLRQLQIQSSNLWHQKEELSWDLTTSPKQKESSLEAQTVQLQTRMQELEKQERELNQSLSAILAAKQRAEASFEPLRTELEQIRSQIAEYQDAREKLEGESTTLAQQKQQLEVEVANLQKQIQELEQYRHELNQFLLAAEPKRQQVETGSRTLQAAIQQLQTQVSSLHGELNQLETQIIDRRGQKEELEQELATLQGQKRQLQGQSVPLEGMVIPKPDPLESPDSETVSNGSLSGLSLPSFPKLRTTGQPATKASARAKKAAQELPEEWMDFMAQLPEHELQVLKAIAEQSNPAPFLKKIAEANLTMPELLIDSINERALETISDIIVEAGAGSNAVIAKEHQKAVKKLISAYEYLAG